MKKNPRYYCSSPPPGSMPVLISLLPGLLLPQVLIDGGFRFPRDDDVSTGPVPLSVDLRSLASLVAPDALFGQVLSLTWV